MLTTTSVAKKQNPNDIEFRGVKRRSRVPFVICRCEGLFCLLFAMVVCGCEPAKPQSAGAVKALASAEVAKREDTKETQYQTTFGPTMGTKYEVKLANPPEDLPADWKLTVDLELRRVNDQMSTYLKTSEVSQFNESSDLEWFPVSKETAEVVAAALEIAAKTGGAYDITVGPLVDLWGFGPGERKRTVPSDAAIDEARASIGYQHVEARLDPPGLRKSKALIRIDLSSIAKGHAVDRVIDKLSGLGCQNVFVNIGGEIAARGNKGIDGPWMSGVERPGERVNVLLFPVPLHDEAIATSGDYRNFFPADGKRYSHTIDPRSGRPVTHELALVSIVTKDCMTADAWATALNVLGPKEGKRIAVDAGIDAFLLARDGKNLTAESIGRFENWYQAAVNSEGER